MIPHWPRPLSPNCVVTIGVAVVLTATTGALHAQVTPPGRSAGQPARVDAARSSAPLQGQAPANPRLLPDISVVGDLIGDLSPDSSTQEDRTRFGIRELEVALLAAVDPYFRGDVYLGFSDEEGVHLEQAYLTTSSLPWELEVRLGRYLMPFSKQNTTHRHDLHTVEYPYVLQRYLGPEGLKGTGISVSRIFAPFGFYQELLVSVNDRFGEAPEELTTSRPVNEDLDGLTYTARLRNYWDLSSAANVELSASALTALVEQPVTGAAGEVNAAASRQTMWGVDLTYRWRPPRQGLYRSFILQAEVLQQHNRRPGELPPPAPGDQVVYDGLAGTLTGGYVFARYQLGRRTFVGARFDTLDDPEFGGARTEAASAYWQFYPSEFSKLMAAFERVRFPGGAGAANRILLQATFALGPHRPHPF